MALHERVHSEAEMTVKDSVLLNVVASPVWGECFNMAFGLSGLWPDI
jgi:hypothetical protein